MNTEYILRTALDRWGEESQLDMVIEECAELIDAIQKRRRNRASDHEVVEEGVDVELCLEQLKMMLNAPEEWELMRHAKLGRLAILLKESHQVAKES